MREKLANWCYTLANEYLSDATERHGALLQIRFKQKRFIVVLRYIHRLPLSLYISPTRPELSTAGP